jgi:hypothetical protein
MVLGRALDWFQSAGGTYNRLIHRAVIKGWADADSMRLRFIEIESNETYVVVGASNLSVSIY